MEYACPAALIRNDEAIGRGIIIGAGHNGLILQAYLGKAGLKTLCVERRHVAGGGLSTVEDPRHPGFLHNTHAFFQRAITAMPWYAELSLSGTARVTSSRSSTSRC